MSLETLDAISMVKKPVRGAEIHIRFTALIIFSNSIALGGKVKPRVTGSFIFFFYCVSSLAQKESIHQRHSVGVLVCLSHILM